ncbi:uncharacterized protein METZ01_LOCUS365308, partial [marine metagenome]
MKIYFAGAIRGGREDAQLYEKLIAYLKEKGQVLTEHIGSTDLNREGETSSKDEEIYNRDIKWLKSADIVVAEVTTPSLGVGYELGIAEKLNIPVLCLYRPEKSNRLSAMLSGNSIFTCREYTVFVEAQKWIDDFIQSP